MSNQPIRLTREQFSRKARIRFYASIRKTRKCWFWEGSRDLRGGYGAFKYLKKNYRANRVAFALHYGEVPADLHVLHNCDTPACVRPSHLHLGTHEQNMHEAALRGRKRYSPDSTALKHLQSVFGKLSREQVELIKSKPSLQRGDLARLAREFGVSRTAVWRVRRGDTWRNIKPANTQEITP